MPGGLPSFRVTVGSSDYTYEAENLTFSNVDPGGFEIASFDVQSGRANLILPGSKVRITDGIGTLWEGRVAEPAKSIKHGWHSSRKVGSTTTRISCEGSGACLKDNDMSMVYVDRDLTRWQAPSITRQVAISAGHGQIGSSQVGADPTSGSPALVQTATDSWVSPNEPFCEAVYDAGPLNLIAKVYYDLTVDAAVVGSSWVEVVNLVSDGNFTTTESTANLNSAVEQKNYLAPATPYRFAAVDHKFLATPGGVQGAQFNAYWHNMTVYGNHGLTGRGADPVGFYTSDIAGSAALRAIAAGAPMKIGRVDTLSQYIVPHYVQYTPIPHEQIIADMAKLAPAHYGVWESSSIFDDLPEFVFVAYSNEADFTVGLADCDEVDLSERLANMYTSAIITYQDAAGTEYNVSVTLPNAVLDAVGIGRTNVIDIGLSTSLSASVFANFVLQALYLQARSAGTVTLPTSVRDRKGALVPAYRIRAGLNRIRITDVPDRTGLFTGSDRDSFRVSRVECNVDTTSGQATTRVEVDAGPNLIETLTSRFNIASSLGQGA